ncbi:hypothetical protein SAMN04515671_4230 [Nakamurella panacisegetis]|uniref:PEP-CTERM protein-sorting domain-containing protein n=1 Tax=Nakamurella panacisegetis TaxID=1090615 RepID=A0A1H0SQ28_9ACTN|nr:hypothetical protein [Nakamurella panacisegetis]SDP43755.1 hypothetical protein SAMN04515671_4230 [Nakamurella panacisegetis]
MTNPDPNGTTPPREPSVVPAVILLGFAAVLIVVVLVKPSMSYGLKLTITLVAVAMVVALLVYAVFLFRTLAKRGRR